MTTEPYRRYFAAQGPDATALIKLMLSLQNEHAVRMKEFVARHGGELVMHNSDGYPSAVLIEEGKPVPDGFKNKDLHSQDGKVYMVCKALGNTKAGRAIKKEMATVGGFSASDLICQHYSVENFQLISGSHMWVPVGWAHVKKDIVTLSVPQGGMREYEYIHTKYPELREIKKSEYIAITEE